MLQGSLLDNQELLDSLDQAKAKSASINASLQDSRQLQVTKQNSYLPFFLAFALFW